MDDVDQVTLQLVAERIKSLSRLTEQGFDDMQRQLDDVRGLPKEVAALKERQEAHERRVRDSQAAQDKRIDAMANADGRGSEWRRGSLPIILLTCVLALTSLVAVIQGLVGH